MPSLGGLPEVPCARCERRTSGLAWGELCPACRGERRRRASRLAGRAALVSTVLTALWLSFRLPPDPTARLYGALALLVTYVIVRRIASRVAMELLPR